MDFGDLYAPTVFATSSVRLLAAFANEYDLELCHFDVDQAFVRADLRRCVHEIAGRMWCAILENC